jgi:hypothetical protein
VIFTVFFLNISGYGKALPRRLQQSNVAPIGNNTPWNNPAHIIRLEKPTSQCAMTSYCSISQNPPRHPEGLGRQHRHFAVKAKKMPPKTPRINYPFPQIAVTVLLPNSSFHSGSGSGSGSAMFTRVGKRDTNPTRSPSECLRVLPLSWRSAHEQN